MQDIIKDVIDWVPILISAAAAAMAILPQGKAGSKWDEIRTVVNYLALNIGHAKNAKE